MGYHRITGFPKGHIPHNIIRPKLEPSESLAYTLGVLKGDGCAFISSENAGIIKLLSADLLFNISFGKALKEIGLHPKTKQWQKPRSTLAKRDIYETLAISKEFVRWYKSLTLDGIKDLLFGSQLRRAFIKGFYESEGGLHKTNRRNVFQLSIWNTDLKLLQTVREILRELGFSFNMNLRKRTGFMRATRSGVLTNAKREEVKQFLLQVKPVIKNELAEEILYGN